MDKECLISVISSLSILFLLDHAFGALYLKSHFHSQGLLDFLLCFFSRNFTDLLFTFKFVIRFELIFVKGVKANVHFF